MTGTPWGQSVLADTDWLTLGESAARLGIPEQTLRSRIDLGAIPRQLVRVIDGTLHLHPGIAPEPRTWRLPFLPAPAEKWWEEEEEYQDDDAYADEPAYTHAPAMVRSGAEWLSISETANALGIQEHILLQEIVLHHVPEPLVRIDDDTVLIHRSVAYPSRLAWESTVPRRISGGSAAAIPLAPARPKGPRIGTRTGALVNRIALSQVLWLVGAVATLIIGGVIYLTHIGKNPAGLFADEAMIGVATNDLVHHKMGWFPPPLFYHHFDYHHLGALPLYNSAPFVAVLGLSDFSIRLASIVWALFGFLMLILLVRRLHWRWAEVGVIAFALTPITIHFARVQFGQTGSLFCVAAGMYAWARAREAGSSRWAIGSGLLIGASIYGGGAYYIAAPIILFALIVGEVVTRRTNFRGYRATLFGIIGFAITTIPIIYRAATDSAFLERMREKQGDQVNGLALSERISHVLDNYSKYFSFEYLFRVGETGMPGGFNMRHSVPGAGELSWIILPLVLLGIVAIFRVKDEASRVFGVAGLVILILYPLPDALTSNLNDPPYSVTVGATLIFIPLLAGLGMHWLTGIVVRRAQGREWAGALAALGILALVLLGGFRFWDGPYRDYPNVSAEYYGWQFGAGPSIALFEQHPGYDRYFLDGDFNAAFIFPHFYLADNPEMLAKTATGWPSYMSDSQHRDLYSIRADRYNALVQSNDIMRLYVKLIDIIRYPNGQIAMYLVEIGPTDQWPGRTVPR